MRFKQCFGSVLISIQIRIQHFRSIRIWIRLQIQVFSWPKLKRENFFLNIFLSFSVIYCFYTLIEDFQAQVKTIRPSAKWAMLFLTWNYRFFNLFGHHFDCPGSGSGSRRAISIRIHMDPVPDPYPDPKHCFKLCFNSNWRTCLRGRYL